LLDLLNDLANRLNSKFDTDAELQEKLGGLNRTIQIELNNDVSYYLRVVGGKIVDIVEDVAEEPDLKIITDRATFEGIINGTVKPLKAYALQKIRLKGSLKDRFLFKDLLSGKKKEKK